jgi:hypothetical protein
MMLAKGFARGVEDQLVRAISAPFPDSDATEAAERVIMSGPTHLLRHLYPAIVAHGTLPQAFDHLLASGADLDQLTIPVELYRATKPLSRIIGMPRDPRAALVSMSWVKARMERHTSLLFELLRNLGDAAGAFLVQGGQSLTLSCPTYRRWSHDLDIAVADIESGLGIIGALVQQLGFRVERCTINEDRGPTSAIARVVAAIDGHELHAGVNVRRGFFRLASTRGEGMEDSNLLVNLFDQRDVLTLSPADMLIRVLLRTAQDGWLTHLRRNDARILLTGRAGPLDWVRASQEARTVGVAGIFRHMADQVERIEGRSLAPFEVAEALAPSMGERALLHSLRSADLALENGRNPSKLFSVGLGEFEAKIAPKVWNELQQHHEGGVTGLVRRAYLAFQWRVLKAQVRAVYGARGHPRIAAPSIRVLRPMMHSLCELDDVSARHARFGSKCLANSPLGRRALGQLQLGDRTRLDRLLELVFYVEELKCGSSGDSHARPSLGEGTTSPNLAPHRCDNLRWIGSLR